MGEDELRDADNTLCLPTIWPWPHHLSSTNVFAETMMSLRCHLCMKDIGEQVDANILHRMMMMKAMMIGGGIVQGRIPVEVVVLMTNPKLPPPLARELL